MDNIYIVSKVNILNEVDSGKANFSPWSIRLISFPSLSLYVDFLKNEIYFFYCLF